MSDRCGTVMHVNPPPPPPPACLVAVAVVDACLQTAYTLPAPLSNHDTDSG